MRKLNLLKRENKKFLFQFQHNNKRITEYSRNDINKGEGIIENYYD